MKQFLCILILIVSIAFAGCKEKNKSKNINLSETTEKWISLFNGNDINNWIVKIKGHPLGENIHNTFRVENGVIKVSYDGYENFNNSFGHLFYKAPFSNYKLRLQYRFIGEQVADGADWAKRNSGVMIHCQPPESMRINQDFPLSIEVQLLGGFDENLERPTGNLCTPGTNVVMNGELFTPHCVVSTSKTYYGEQWVNLEVIVKNDSITHLINGEKVISYSTPQVGGDLNDFSEEWKSKDGDLLTGGYISLQSESHPVEFKNIELLELQ